MEGILQKLYTESEVSGLLEIQKGNCYVAILSQTKDANIAKATVNAPEPNGGKWRKNQSKLEFIEKESKIINLPPKEKAQELVDKYKEIIPIWNAYIDGLRDEEDILTDCVGCALIGVEEIIKDNPNIYDSDRLNYKYWNEV